MAEKWMALIPAIDREIHGASSHPCKSETRTMKRVDTAGIVIEPSAW